MHQFGELLERGRRAVGDFLSLLQKEGSLSNGGGWESVSNPGGNYGIILLIYATYSNNEFKRYRTNNSRSL